MLEPITITSVAKRLRLSLSEPVNEAVLRDSLRSAVAALEQRLDALRAKGGLADSIVAQHPRLLRDIEGLEGSLSDTLTGFWEIQRAQANLDSQAVEKIASLAKELEAIGEQETELLFESQVHLGGTD